jgi:hypothetical protein
MESDKSANYSLVQAVLKHLLATVGSDMTTKQPTYCILCGTLIHEYEYSQLGKCCVCLDKTNDSWLQCTSLDEFEEDINNVLKGE